MEKNKKNKKAKKGREKKNTRAHVDQGDTINLLVSERLDRWLRVNNDHGTQPQGIYVFQEKD